MVYLVYQGPAQVNARYLKYRVLADPFKIDEVLVSPLGHTRGGRTCSAFCSYAIPQPQCFVFKARTTNPAWWLNTSRRSISIWSICVYTGPRPRSSAFPASLLLLSYSVLQFLSPAQLFRSSPFPSLHYSPGIYYPFCILDNRLKMPHLLFGRQCPKYNDHIFQISTLEHVL